MSYSVSVGGIESTNDIEPRVAKVFAENYPDPAKGVSDAVRVSAEEAYYLADTLYGMNPPEGCVFNVTVSGHVKQDGEDETVQFASVQVTIGRKPEEVKNETPEAAEAADVDIRAVKAAPVAAGV